MSSRRLLSTRVLYTIPDNRISGQTGVVGLVVVSRKTTCALLRRTKYSRELTRGMTHKKILKQQQQDTRKDLEYLPNPSDNGDDDQYRLWGVTCQYTVLSPQHPVWLPCRKFSSSGCDRSGWCAPLENETDGSEVKACSTTKYRRWYPNPPSTPLNYIPFRMVLFAPGRVSGLLWKRFFKFRDVGRFDKKGFFLSASWGYGKYVCVIEGHHRLSTTHVLHRHELTRPDMKQ